MKHRGFFRRILSLLLSAAALVGAAGAWPAKAVEFNIDGSGFADPEETLDYMYYWHKGAPPTKLIQDKDGNYIQYPTLITWDKKYFLCFDSDMLSIMDAFQKAKASDGGDMGTAGGDWLDIVAGVITGGLSTVVTAGYELANLIQNNSDVDYDHDSAAKPAGWYAPDRIYPISSNGLLNNLGFDANALDKYGEAVSLTIPEGVPYLIPAVQNGTSYGILLSKVVGTGPRSVYKWLMGVHRLYAEYVEVPRSWGRTRARYKTAMDWYLDYLSSSYDPPSRYLSPTWTWSRTGSSIGDPPGMPLSNRVWQVTPSGGGYTISTPGTYRALVGSSYPDDGKKNLQSYISDHLKNNAPISLSHQSSALRSSGWNGEDADTVFTLYYAEPVLVDFYQTSFTVAKGQTIEMVGPIAIGPDCTVTVKDGGLLSVSGWVMNNGQIIVESGGTLVIQDRETLTEDFQHGAITSVGAKPGTASGHVACDGTIIIMPDCKLCCAGLYGLELGMGAQVVNYGQIMAENLKCCTDYVIENRGATSAVFPGWGVTDSGYLLTRTQITGGSYTAQGALERIAAVNLPANAVYGPGASRVYLNNTHINLTTNKLNSSVTSYVPKLPGMGGGEDEVIDDGVGEGEVVPDIPIYFDEKYGVPFFIYMENGEQVVYYYEGVAGLWVHVNDDGSFRLWNGPQYSPSDNYNNDGTLPEGTRMASGLVAGSEKEYEYAEKVQLLYEHRANVFWFRSNDGKAYYYDDTLQLYVRIADGVCYVYPGIVNPPPQYTDSMYITEDREAWPDQYFSTYSPGMTIYMDVNEYSGLTTHLQEGTLDKYVECMYTRFPYEAATNLYVYTDDAGTRYCIDPKYVRDRYAGNQG